MNLLQGRDSNMVIKEIKYGTTNTYLIKGESGALLFDTGWVGTLPAFCHAMGAAGEKVQDIRYILISHYHPDQKGFRKGQKTEFHSFKG